MGFGLNWAFGVGIRQNSSEFECFGWVWFDEVDFSGICLDLEFGYGFCLLRLGIWCSGDFRI